MPARLHLCNISFVDGENLAGPRAASTIGKASTALGEHRTGEE